MDNRIYLNYNWKFSNSYNEDMLNADSSFNFENINIPHTCVETPLHYFDESIYQMVCFYKKSIIPPSGWSNKKVILTFEGVAHQSEVYINSQKVAEHKCGYTAFSVDITKYLVFGEENTIALVVDSNENLNVPPFGYVIDYMTYGGIYRDVYIEVKDNVYIDDIYFIPEFPKLKNSEKTDLCLKSQVTINNYILDYLRNSNNSDDISNVGYSVELRQFIKKKGDNDYTLIGNHYDNIENIQLHIDNKADDMKLDESSYVDIYNLSFDIKDIDLWHVASPKLYEIKTELLVNNELIDINITTYGFRKSEFKNDGYYLNNKKLKIVGLNRHQSYPYVGYAMPKSMQIEDVRILKHELGLNAVRTSHYPQSHDFISACDEMGLLVFTEMPGWQHIGDDEWKNQAVENTKDMVLQYRNHPSIILWGVRINESKDDDEFYKRTNEMARKLDVTRPTGGVRCFKNSNLLEDVYTYNDFSHRGFNEGCDPKKNVTSDMNKPYLISEYNGHMYPTKAFDCEEHRVEHAIRHAKVINEVAANDDIVGSFGWCMTDYNTHKDFGSGDRICYHGVMDMFRNPKLAAAVYNVMQEDEINLHVLSSMDIGEHPECNRGNTWIVSNADSVKMYKNDNFIKEYKGKSKQFPNLKHGPMLIDDYIGDEIFNEKKYSKKQAKAIKEALNDTALNGLTNLPKKHYLTAMKMMMFKGMKPCDAVELFTKYIGDWGGESTVYKFEAIKDGNVVKTIIKQPMKKVKLDAVVSHTTLVESRTYDVASIRIYAKDEYDNVLSFCNNPITIQTEGDIELIGPNLISLQGGMSGTYVKSCNRAGNGSLILRDSFNNELKIDFTVVKDN